MTKSEFIKRYLDLFAARPELYAIRLVYNEGQEDERALYPPSNYYLEKDGRPNYTTERVQEVVQKVGSPLYGPEAVEAHLTGDAFLGVYPIHSDSTVRFFALDFDAHSEDGEKKSKEDVWKETYRHYKILKEEAELPVYIEVSRSGNGFHIWGFLEEPVYAGMVRHALKQFIESTNTFDRMFPNQDSVHEGRPWGNLIALPLYGPAVNEGRGAFFEVNKAGELVRIPDQKEYLSAFVERIPKKRIEYLFDNSPQSYIPETQQVFRTADLEGLAGGYKVTDPRFGCEWVNWHWEHPDEPNQNDWYALACQFAQLQGGRKLFHEFSKRDPSRYNPKQADQKFDHAIRQNKPQTCGYIRDELGGPACHCDEKYAEYGVTHPYDIAKIPLFDLAQAIRESERISTPDEDIDDVIAWMKEVHKDPSKGMGLLWGWRSLDEITGLMPSTLNVLAARPGMGKTAITIDLARKLAWEKKIPIVFFSLEMSRRQLLIRLVANLAQVNGKRMRMGLLNFKEWRRVERARSEIKKGFFPLFIDDTTRDVRKMMDIAGDIFFQYGQGLIIIDYMQLAEWLPNENNEYQAVTRISKESKLTAKILEIPVLALSQLNRGGEDATPDGPTLDSWLRSSGQIEQDADTIVFLLGEKGKGVKERTLAFHKQRDLESNVRATLEFNQPIMRFAEMGTWLRGPVPTSTSGLNAPTIAPVSERKDLFEGM